MIGSVDPVLEMTDPRQMGGYAYAGDNPTTHSDPSGLMRPPPDSDSGSDSLATSMENDAIDGCTSNHCIVSVVRRYSNPVYVANLETTAINRAYAIGVEREKEDAARKAQQHRHWWQSAASFVYHASGLADVVDCVTDPTVDGCVKAAVTVVTVVETGGESTVANIGIHMAEDLGEDAATQVVKDGVEDTVANASSEGASGAGAQSATDASASAAEDTGAASSTSTSCLHSFVGTTPVLLADGSTKPIKDVKLGDKVRATDPATGSTTAQPVTALHDNHDSDLADVTVESANGAVSTVHTTWHHPFWDATHHRWTEAAQLAPGTQLSAGVVLSVRTRIGAQDMHDLTIASTHTYYVLAGITAVLVHNCGTEGGWGGLKGDPYDPDVIAQRSLQWQKRFDDINARAAQKAVARGQGPKEIGRIDEPEESVPGSQWHAQGKGRGAPGINMDGTFHDGDPHWPSRVVDWLRGYGWRIPE